MYVDVIAAFDGFLEQPKVEAKNMTIKANPNAVNAALNTPRSEEGKSSGAKSEGNASLYGVVAVTAAVALISGYLYFKWSSSAGN